MKKNTINKKPIKPIKEKINKKELETKPVFPVFKL